MSSATGIYTISFNGEIFNYKDLRTKLESRYKFITRSDTEVILAACEIESLEWLLKNANGMFAFALYNNDTRELVLARDRFGIKPLHFFLKEADTIVFSSEIKGILSSGLVPAEFNEEAIDEYLGYRYIREPNTFFKHIYQVKPAHYYVIDSELKSIKHNVYWRLPELNFESNYSEEDVIQQTQKEVEEAIKRWFIADVKVGAYLSGGVDSSLTSAILAGSTSKSIDTYTIGFQEGGFNEFDYAKRVSEIYNTNHHEYVLEKQDYIDYWKELIWFKEAPLGVPNEIPLAIMSSKLSSDITVVISGEGADELFGGYGRIFRAGFDFKNIDKGVKPSFYDYFIDKYEYVSRAIRDKYLNVSCNYRNIFDNELRESFSKYRNEENIFRFFHGYHIKGLLNRVDTTTMQTSVEARPPFLDHKLVEFVYQNVPYDLKLKWNDDQEGLAENRHSSNYSETLDVPKYILKKIAEKYLPEDIVYRKKVGFPVPLTEWMPDLETMAKEHLSQAFWLKKNMIDDLINDIGKDERSGQLLWMFLNIELFRLKYFNKNWVW
jgi:asparagine synthase (glutamine-hydrolysing)